MTIQETCKAILGDVLENVKGKKPSSIKQLPDRELAALRLYFGSWPRLNTWLGCTANSRHTSDLYYGKELTEDRCRELVGCDEPLPEPEVPIEAVVGAARINALQSTINKLEKALLDERIKTAAIVEAMVAQVGVLNPRPFPKMNRNEDAETPEYAVLDVSDWQFGSTWTNEEVAGWGDCNSQILLGRVELLTQKVIHLVNLQRKARPVPWCVVNCLGDLIENEVIWPSQGVHIDMSAASQLAVCFTAAERMLISLLDNFETVQMFCCPGNHGRMGPKKNSQHPHNNWDFILYHFLAERFRNEPRLKMFIASSPWLAYTLEHAPKFNHVLLHGDTIPNTMGIPWYGIERETARVSELINEPIHFLHMGHWHQAAQINRACSERIINGCLTGASPGAVRRMLASIPSQLLMGLHPKYGMTWSYKVLLADFPDNRTDENGMKTPYYTGLSDLAKSELE